MLQELAAMSIAMFRVQLALSLALKIKVSPGVTISFSLSIPTLNFPLLSATTHRRRHSDQTPSECVARRRGRREVQASGVAGNISISVMSLSSCYRLPPNQ